MPPRVVLLCGSPRPKGNTRQILEECAKVLEREHVEGEIVSLAGKRIESCTACYRCNKEKRCHLEDDFEPIMNKVKEAQGFIVASPVYFGTARGDVMNLLQRLGMVSRSGGGWMAGKVGGPIAVARRGGHTLTLQEMTMFFMICDLIVPGSTYWNMVIGRNPGEALNDKEGMDTVRHFAGNVARLILKLGQ